jgi:flavin-dependent dehydrogenase
MSYDVIIVGGRCAGSSLGLLLARAGTRVLLVDRTTFPSDTVNGHYIHPAGVRSLARWGILPRVLGESAPRPVRAQRMDFGAFDLRGRFHWPDGTPAFGIAPRRMRLDALLVDSAAAAGVEVREGFAVDNLIWEDDTVVGIRGHGQNGAHVEERARLVVGADGLHSRVAAAVGAEVYDFQPSQTCAYYSHWADLPSPELDVFVRPRQYLLTFPVDDGLTCVGIGWPRSEFARVRSDLEAEFERALDTVPSLAARVRAGRRVEPLRGTADLPSYLRTPYGRGWALVGDAGCRVDPITGQGITDAFRDAELLADAIQQGLGGVQPLEAALPEYQRRRDAAVMPVYRYTQTRASLQPPSPELGQLLTALQGNQPQMDRFVGLTAGTTSFSDFFAPDSVARIIGAAAPRAA